MQATPLPLNELDRLCAERGFFAVQRYIVAGGFREFTVCYDDLDAARAVALLPTPLCIENESAYTRRLLRTADPLAVRLGEQTALCLVVMQPDHRAAEPALYPIANINALLAAGEERLAILDRVGWYRPADPAALQAAIDSGLCLSNGAITEKQQARWQALQQTSDSATPQPTPELTAPGTGTLARAYPNPRGLFVFDHSGIEWSAELGRGEHNVFLQYTVGNRFGRFRPYSFTAIVGSPERSVAVFEELLACGVLDTDGGLERLELLPSRLNSFPADVASSAAADAAQQVRALLAAGRRVDREQLLRDFKVDRERILTELAELPADLPANARFETAERIARNRSHPDYQRFFRAYEEARISAAVDAAAIRHRGLILGGDDGRELLLLITDAPLATAPYYRQLLNFFGDALPGARIRLAHAHAAPIARSQRSVAHAIVQALGMLDRPGQP